MTFFCLFCKLIDHNSSIRLSIFFYLWACRWKTYFYLCRYDKRSKSHHSCCCCFLIFSFFPAFCLADCFWRWIKITVLIPEEIISGNLWWFHMILLDDIICMFLRTLKSFPWMPKVCLLIFFYLISIFRFSC